MGRFPKEDERSSIGDNRGYFPGNDCLRRVEFEFDRIIPDIVIVGQRQDLEIKINGVEKAIRIDISTNFIGKAILRN